MLSLLVIIIFNKYYGISKKFINKVLERLIVFKGKSNEYFKHVQIKNTHLIPLLIGGTTYAINRLTAVGWIRPVPSRERLKEMIQERKDNMQDRFQESKQHYQTQIQEKKTQMMDEMRRYKTEIKNIKDRVKKM